MYGDLGFYGKPAGFGQKSGGGDGSRQTARGTPFNGTGAL